MKWRANVHRSSHGAATVDTAGTTVSAAARGGVLVEGGCSWWWWSEGAVALLSTLSATPPPCLDGGSGLVFGRTQRAGRLRSWASLSQHEHQSGLGVKGREEAAMTPQ